MLKLEEASKFREKCIEIDAAGSSECQQTIATEDDDEYFLESAVNDSEAYEDGEIIMYEEEEHIEDDTGQQEVKDEVHVYEQFEILESSSVDQQHSVTISDDKSLVGDDIKRFVKCRKSYSSQQKLEAVGTAELLGNRQAAKVFNIDESNIRKWRLNKDLLIEINRERGTKRKPNLHWPSLDQELKTWSHAQMQSGVLLKPSEIKTKSLEIAEKLKLKDFRGTSSYVFKFMERYRITSRPAKNPVKKKIKEEKMLEG